MESARKEKRSFDKLGTSGSEAVLVADSVLTALRSATRAAHPHEACGILLGSAEHITGFTPTANVHAAPATHFEIDPQALIDAHRAARAGGPEVVGYFHSHPAGPAQPSATDARMASGDGRIWAIAGTDEGADSTSLPLITFWRDDIAGFTRLSYALASR